MIKNNVFGYKIHGTEHMSTIRIDYVYNYDDDVIEKYGYNCPYFYCDLVSKEVNLKYVRVSLDKLTAPPDVKEALRLMREYEKHT